MKLRFRSNSLRLRLNQQEVWALASGQTLEEKVHFPGESTIAYVLEPASEAGPDASFAEGVIRVFAPQNEVRQWAAGPSIGMYFELAANGSALKVAIEKDLECLDGPVDEHDPHAFPRPAGNVC